MRKSLFRSCLYAFLCVACWAVTGCQSRSLDTTYGPSKGLRGRTSINGFGALRNAYVDSGFRDRDVNRLTNRARQIDTIVWTPTHITPISSEVTRWMESWFRLGKRTLVYVVPDSGSEANYWKEARADADPEQRLEYRRRWAGCLNQQTQWTLNRKAVVSNGWFQLRPKLQEATAKHILLSKEEKSNQLSSEESAASVRLEWVIEPFDKDNQPSNSGTIPFQATGPGGAAWIPFENAKPTSTPTDFNAVVTTPSGEATIAEITSDRWPDSKIIVVAGGSLVTNYAMTRRANRMLVQTLVDRSSRGGTEALAGFCSVDGNVPVSETARSSPGMTGMELLTVYPLSLVTIHAALLGLIICLMMFPIFGRAKKVERGSLNDFGDHLDAVAALMKKNGGQAYARKQISDYMRRMHGETSGPWVLPETETTQLLTERLRSNHPVSRDPVSRDPFSGEHSVTSPAGDQAGSSNNDHSIASHPKETS